MRIAVIQFSVRSKAAIAALSGGIVAGFEAQGHQVKLFDGRSEESIPVPMFDFITVVSETKSYFSSKASPELGKFLAASVRSSGKRSLAVLLKTCFRPSKASLCLMAALEKEGLVVIDSVVFSGKEDAAQAFKGYKVER